MMATYVPVPVCICETCHCEDTSTSMLRTVRNQYLVPPVAPSSLVSYWKEGHAWLAISFSEQATLDYVHHRFFEQCLKQEESNQITDVNSASYVSNPSYEGRCNTTCTVPIRHGTGVEWALVKAKVWLSTGSYQYYA
ncbi:hypothetical protein SEMRO_246_G097601.1 [Seminavis robusta]|uniref:Uncharacterized protein n=1 Tax=Seminavis robusta TaxID=568900 RepID=A0A9N8DNH3_9STRA|nr:hypothetical protein SEMRO_246_G097601.1 [Seminavis robusta]|eukprot:Sro246_g097601.1  (137) ;mRNA; r:12100-12510